jgi:predicted membrane channel-forming protein YqfA (hemolysin III family)
MHKYSKDNCIILKDRVNDPGLAFAVKVGLGPFWTLVQVLSYVHVLQLFVSTFVSSFWHERISTVEKIYTKMQCKIYLMIFILINYNQ